MRYEVTARLLGLHPLPKPVAIDLESARWLAFLDTLEVRVATGSVSSAQRSTLLSTLDRARARQPSLRRTAVGVSSDGLLNASWSFIDLPGRVFSLEIQRDGAVDRFYRDAATDTSRGSEDELPRELPEEALLFLTAGFRVDPAGVTVMSIPVDGSPVPDEHCVLRLPVPPKDFTPDGWKPSHQEFEPSGDDKRHAAAHGPARSGLGPGCVTHDHRGGAHVSAPAGHRDRSARHEGARGRHHHRRP